MTAHHGPRRDHVHYPEESPQAYLGRAIRCPKRCSSQCCQGQRMQPRKTQGRTQAAGWTPPLREKRGRRAHRATEAVPRVSFGGIGLRSANEICCCSRVCVNASRTGQSAWTHTPHRICNLVLGSAGSFVSCVTRRPWRGRGSFPSDRARGLAQVRSRQGSRGVTDRGRFSLR